MPIRPASLATMSAAIAGVVSTDRDPEVRATLTYASGRRQVVEGTGCHALATDQGGLLALDVQPHHTFVLFTGASCRGSRIIDTGQGPVEYEEPVAAGSVVLG